MVPAKRSLGGTVKELEQLRFCRRELDRRIELQLSDAWYWEIKRKVTGYCIGLKERQMGLSPDQLAGELTDEEEADTRRTHPLLARPPEPESPAYDPIHEHWMSDLRHRVLTYVDALRGR